MLLNEHAELDRHLKLASAAAQRAFNSPTEPTLESFVDGDGAEFLRIRVQTPLDVVDLMPVLAEFDALVWNQLPATFRKLVTLHFDEVV